MKFGMHYIYWQKDLDAVSYIPHLEKAAKAGYDVLEMGDDILLRMSEQQFRELKNAKEALGMELALGIDPPGDAELTASDTKIRENGIAFYQNFFPKLEYLGVKVLGGRFLYTSTHERCIAVQKEDQERGMESLRILAESARDYGVTLNVEVCNRYETHILTTAKQGVEFLRELGESNVKLLLDTFHMSMEEASFSEALLTAGEYLGHVHLIENNRRLLGRGNLPWREIFDALRRIGYDGMLNMEPLVQTGGQLADFCRIWRDMTDGADATGIDAHAKEALQFVRYMAGRQ